MFCQQHLKKKIRKEQQKIAKVVQSQKITHYD